MRPQPCPLPHDFREVHRVEWARLADTPPRFRAEPKPRGKRAAGLRYERKVHAHFEESLGDGYWRSPWFMFGEGEGRRWCQPDALFLDFTRGRIVVLEIKLQHTARAWWQLERLYYPVVRRVFPPDLWSISRCEVVRWYDPAMAFPERIALLPDPREARPEAFGVHIWGGRG